MAFSMIDQSKNVGFFKKPFLVANINLNIDLRIFFLILSGTNVDFQKKKL